MPCQGHTTYEWQMVAIYSEIPISGFAWELVDFNTKWGNFDTKIIFMESMKCSIKLE